MAMQSVGALIAVKTAPCMLPTRHMDYGLPVTGEAVRSWKQLALTSSVERLPASLGLLGGGY